MRQEKGVTFYCITQDTDSNGFDIYINVIKVNDDIKHYDIYSMSIVRGHQQFYYD